MAMHFKIIKEDITKIKIDAIVCLIDSNGSMDKGLSKLIKQRDNNSIEEEVKAQIQELNNGEAIITKSGNLKCNHIIHIASIASSIS